MAQRRKFRSTFYRLAVSILEDLDFDDSLLQEVLHEGAVRHELFCIGILYDTFFDLETATIEKICEMCGFLDVGMEQGFWLSFYQAADLMEKLEHFKIRSDWVTDKSQYQLLRQAKSRFKKLPIIVSDVTLREIEEKRLRLWVRGSGENLGQ